MRVTPGARLELLEIVDGRLFAKVRARPEDGRANLAVQALLAAALGVGVSRLQLLRGGAARDKLFRIG